jgi:hypothetical protein
MGRQLAMRCAPRVLQQTFHGKPRGSMRPSTATVGQGSRRARLLDCQASWRRRMASRRPSHAALRPRPGQGLAIRLTGEVEGSMGRRLAMHLRRVLHCTTIQAWICAGLLCRIAQLSWRGGTAAASDPPGQGLVGQGLVGQGRSRQHGTARLTMRCAVCCNIQSMGVLPSAPMGTQRHSQCRCTIQAWVCAGSCPCSCCNSTQKQMQSVVHKQAHGAQ